LEGKNTNIQIIEAVKCKGILTQLSSCVKCRYHLSVNYQTNEVNCEYNNELSRKEYIEQMKDYYSGVIEFGEKNEQNKNS
jgi:hypothetical protein